MISCDSKAEVTLSITLLDHNTAFDLILNRPKLSANFICGYPFPGIL